MLYTLLINRVNIKQIGGLQQAKKGTNKIIEKQKKTVSIVLL